MVVGGVIGVARPGENDEKRHKNQKGGRFVKSIWKHFQEDENLATLYSIEKGPLSELGAGKWRPSKTLRSCRSICIENDKEM